MTHQPPANKASTELRQELDHEKLIELLMPAYKASGLGVEEMDKTIAIIEASTRAEVLTALDSIELPKGEPAFTMISYAAAQRAIATVRAKYSSQGEMK